MTRALCMVAHPDDCVIFAWSFMWHHPHLRWTVAYLTYEAGSDRASELADFWQRRELACVFLGHKDDHRDLITGVCSFDTDQARQQIQALVSDHDLVLTHDQQGDYGHLHHRFVHECVTQVHDRVICFAPISGPGTLYQVPHSAYDPSELPMHHSTILGFHPQGLANRYHVPESCVPLLET